MEPVVELTGAPSFASCRAELFLPVIAASKTLPSHPRRGQGTRTPPKKPTWPLFPGGVNRLADQECRIRARSGREFLRAAIGDFSYVQVALLIAAHAVHVEQPSRKIAQRSPGIEKMPVQVVLDNLRRCVVKGPQVAIGGD